MEVLMPIIWIVIAIFRISFRERETVAIVQRQGTLCRTCVNSHLVKGFDGKGTHLVHDRRYLASY